MELTSRIEQGRLLRAGGRSEPAAENRLEKQPDGRVIEPETGAVVGRAAVPVAEAELEAG